MHSSFRRPPPAPPNVCHRLPGGRNPCLNSSAVGISPSLMQFATARCDGMCGPDTSTYSSATTYSPFPPATQAQPWVCASKVTNATSNFSNWVCNVCNACCREDVDCTECVKRRCPPPGAVFICHGGGGGRHHSPPSCVLVDTVPVAGAKLFTDPNCTLPLGGNGSAQPKTCTAMAPLDPTRLGKKYRCFGCACLLVSGTFPLGDFEDATCNQTCGKPPLPAPAPAPGPPVPPPPPAVPSMEAHSLSTDPSAVCIDGSTPSVYAYTAPPSSGSASTTWVLLLGATSVAFDICISAAHCAQFGKHPPLPAVPGLPPPPPPPAKPPPPPIPLEQGPQSRNCSINPDWCRANHASIPLCDFTLGLSDREDIVEGTGCPLPGSCCAKPTMAWRGRRVLAAALAKLSTLGLAEATDVLVTGVGWAGTAAILNAEWLHQQVALHCELLSMLSNDIAPAYEYDIVHSQSQSHQSADLNP